MPLPPFFCFISSKKLSTSSTCITIRRFIEMRWPETFTALNEPCYNIPMILYMREKENHSIQNYMCPLQWGIPHCNKNVVCLWYKMKNETTSHVATHFRCWSDVHFVCCCCFDKSPDRVTAWFQSMLDSTMFPVVRRFLYPRGTTGEVQILSISSSG